MFYYSEELPKGAYISVYPSSLFVVPNLCLFWYPSIGSGTGHAAHKEWKRWSYQTNTAVAEGFGESIFSFLSFFFPFQPYCLTTDKSISHVGDKYMQILTEIGTCELVLVVLCGSSTWHQRQLRCDVFIMLQLLLVCCTSFFWDLPRTWWFFPCNLQEILKRHRYQEHDSAFSLIIAVIVLIIGMVLGFLSRTLFSSPSTEWTPLLIS